MFVIDFFPCVNFRSNEADKSRSLYLFHICDMWRLENRVYLRDIGISLSLSFPYGSGSLSRSRLFADFYGVKYIHYPVTPRVRFAGAAAPSIVLSNAKIELILETP